MFVAEHPVDFFAAGFSDFINGLAHLTFPSLAGEDAGDFLARRQQRQGIGVTHHVMQAQIRGCIGSGLQHLFVQTGLGVALAHLTQQHPARLGDQSRVGVDAPVRVRG